MAVVWLLYGCCMAVVWLLYGCCMAVVWLLYLLILMVINPFEPPVVIVAYIFCNFANLQIIV